MKNRLFDRRGSKNGKGSARSQPADDKAAAVQRNMQQLGETIVEHVRRSPAASLAIAVACGVALGWLIKRR
jgi:ElaB/YqjD/DUF883 family membrane-anchored ribosome-binding protein